MEDTTLTKEPQESEENGELSNSENTDQPSSKNTNEVLDAIGIIDGNIRLAQDKRGALTMEDCVYTLKATNTLLKFFEPNNKDFANDEINKQFVIFLQAVTKLQASGAFHMEGSMMLWNKLKFIEKEIENRKSPADKLKNLQQKKIAQNNSNNQKGKGRGRNTRNMQ